MRTPNPNNSTEKLVTLIGLASASVFISFPALALINSNHSSFDGSVNNRTHPIESSRTSRQLLAQSTSGTGGTGTGQSGTGTSGTGTGQTGTGTSGTGTGQT
ncbi:MAG TPA: hypothetical protein DDZ80_29680, partial [Cyanobacteria bacterium UBA8803]|nr:hypothetical protein [Cyanobacteria bacterium UBA8803]